MADNNHPTGLVRALALAFSMLLGVLNADTLRVQTPSGVKDFTGVTVESLQTDPAGTPQLTVRMPNGAAYPLELSRVQAITFGNGPDGAPFDLQFRDPSGTPRSFPAAKFFSFDGTHFMAQPQGIATAFPLDPAKIISLKAATPPQAEATFAPTTNAFEPAPAPAFPPGQAPDPFRRAQSAPAQPTPAADAPFDPANPGASAGFQQPSPAQDANAPKTIDLADYKSNLTPEERSQVKSAVQKIAFVFILLIGILVTHIGVSIWMMIDAIRKGSWGWLVSMLLCGIGVPWYVRRYEGPGKIVLQFIVGAEVLILILLKVMGKMSRFG